MVTDDQFPKFHCYFSLASLMACTFFFCSIFTSNVYGISRPAIAIIIDDMGYHLKRNVAALNLPGELTYSILPNTPHAQSIAAMATRKNKEIMLHLPMESITHHFRERIELTLEMNKVQIQRQLNDQIANLPHIMGINNHMGSLLTQHPGHMQWVMETVNQRKLYFVDSYTTEKSIVRRIANENWVPTIRRDIFLDHDRNPTAINRQFDRLLKLASKNGIALAIAHPYPQTLALLQKRLRTLTQGGYELVFVSKLIERNNLQRYKKWRVFLSP